MRVHCTRNNLDILYFTRLFVAIVSQNSALDLEYRDDGNNDCSLWNNATKLKFPFVYLFVCLFVCLFVTITFLQPNYNYVSDGDLLASD